MTDEQPSPTVRTRALAAGLSPERLAAHVTNKVLTLDGEPVTDLDQPAPAGTRLTITGS